MSIIFHFLEYFSKMPGKYFQGPRRCFFAATEKLNNLNWRKIVRQTYSGGGRIMFTFAVVYLQSVFEALVRGQVGSLPSAMCLWPRVGDSLMANVRPPLSQ